MHRQTLVALSWCLVIGTAVALLLEVHRSHERAPLPAAPIARTLAPVEAPVDTPVATPVEARLASPLPLAAPPLEQAKPAIRYSGNTNTYKFHEKSCRHYSCKNCTAHFATREEALEAGYRPCGVCDP